MAWVTYDIAADLGCKTLTAVGSITGGTPTLTLTSNPGFVIGDDIIIATGFEAGAGAKGTQGVGGNWPSTSYANEAALLAASPAEGTRAWDRTTGYVWYRGATVWEDIHLLTSLWYQTHAVPLSLAATITNVVGNVLTLDTNATVTATSANIYFDNTGILNAAWGNGGTYEDIEELMWTVPTGIFALSSVLSVYGQKNWVISGNGNTLSRFMSPAGAVGEILISAGATYKVLIRDIGFIGNVNNSGYGLIDYGATSLPGYPAGILFNAVTSCIALRCRSTNVFRMAVGGEYTGDTWFIGCEAVRTTPPQSYTQWQIALADSDGGGLLGCSIDSDYLIKGPETFRSTGCYMFNNTFRNAIGSSNSSGAFVMKNNNFTIEALSQVSSVSIDETGEQIFQFNSNIQPPSPDMILGARVIGNNITVEGYINAATDSLVYCAIGANCPNVIIEGGYPDGVSPRGYWQGPDHPGTEPPYHLGGIFIRNSGPSTTVRGMRFNGDVFFSNGAYSIQQENAGASITVTDSIFDHGVAGSGTIITSDNQTNAEFEA